MRVLFLFCIIASINIFSSADLPQCRKLECARYKLIQKRKNYEIRQYGNLRLFALSITKGLGYSKARIHNFLKLLRYIKGDNERHENIPLILPVINGMYFNVTKSKSGEIVKEIPIEDDFRMAFFLPRSLRDPPKAKEDDIHISPAFDGVIYARSFHGDTKKENVYRAQKELHDYLEADGISFDRRLFFVAEYDADSKAEDRYNELLYLPPLGYMFQ